MRRRSTSTLIALAGVVGAVAVPAIAQAAPAFTCEASALRGTVLGQAVEPVVFGRGQSCRTGQATPTLALPELLDANVLVAAGTKTDDALKPAATAAGGLAGARVKLLPSLPIRLPIEAVQAAVAAVPPLSVPIPALGPLLPPTNASVDIRAALAALLPDGLLPQADLLSAGVLSSLAGASCATGDLTLAGSSSVAGLRLLGQPIDVDGALQQNVNVIDSASIDPSKIDLSKVTVTVPGTNAPNLVPPAVLQAAIQPLLDALPNIEIPAAVAQVKLTAAEQTKTGTSLTQRALRVQATLLGLNLLDVVVGEAKVTATGDCPAASGVQPAELQCTDRKLVLLDVFEERGRVRLRGAANKSFVGKSIDIKFRAGGNRVVARAKVAGNGSFTTTAALPPGRVRGTNAARYTAVRGDERSLPLKLVRRMRTSSVRSAGGTVTIRGRVSLPLAAPTQEIRLIRRVACGKAQLIKRFKPKADGSFVVRVKASSRPAVYRAVTRVRKVRTNPKTYPTFTLPRGIDLAER